MADIDRDTLLDIYTRTMKVNRTDEKFRSLLMQGKVAVMYYCVRGQELVSAAAMAALKDEDYVVCTYRGQGEQTAKGIPAEKWWAECLGKVTGTCKGKGGTMHITHPEKGIMVTTGVVGSGLPIANGLAMASQNTGDGKVTMVSFGDGAANIGAFHEALNMAQLYKLPVVFLCQNNRYGEHTAFADHTQSESIYGRAAGYGMKGVRVDGNDVFAMYHAAKDAVDRARAGEGPTLIEAMCYRMMGHFFGADFSYMPKEHLAEMQREDPLPKLRAVMLERQFTEDELDAIVAGIDAEIEDAVAKALAADLPGPEELQIDVFEKVPA
ncbi:MAG: thiamine pyrophosphate-dependent dehydrogenase E1 component subunit alpha [Sphingomonadales bacterium]|jgi:TPP-dependent pyruvate/acetoin dehydrogenase alpha subunit|nr:thiamine pyrophosphate-dependent dehydrogenase E1 component subunit alpha [Sphingomonadales bacterium]MBK6490680.1 thiamine pyrophosphate-dependent dehydrogenase E1 component subunit alpha [Sphingomonadales bacterium]MBK6719367.1 thiamine pyrophosphate-dependent dehydrogenase E1 component subunit alpha [Sphingomonadales bacterium]MBK8859419.1 thiamine pyrophosphate-dependent dehydrogenase E1 component subunit alpha [Sphingomonadales bacterium]MBK9589642.1 thiamine pyrophosphate-dependent deh